MASAGAERFVVIQEDGYSEIELLEADDLGELYEKLQAKTGGKPR